MTLVTPFLVDSQANDGTTYDFEPTHITSWTTQSVAEPSRCIALASPDNSIWIYPQSHHVPKDAQNQTLGSSVPVVLATEPTPGGTPPNGRPGNPRLSSFTQRSRAPSAASSTRTSSSRHRVTSFSPPSTASAVLTSLSPTTATATANDGHGRAHSLSERAELIEHLRDQQARNSQEGQARSSVGLGINLGRKLDVHGHADHGRESGTTSPRSVKSSDSQNTTIGSRLMDWAKGSNMDEEKSRKDLSDQVAEIAVEREMQKESAEDAKQEEERKLIEAAMERTSPSVAHEVSVAPAKLSRPVRRIILRQPGRGRIVDMKVFEELELLCVLKHTGSLDIFRTDTLAEVCTIDLEEPERRSIASSSKTPLRISPFWKWQRLHLLSNSSEKLLFVEALPWSCGMPSHNGDVTRVIILSILDKHVQVENRLELPGQGTIGVCCPSAEPYLVHSTSSSLTSYPIITRMSHLSKQPDRPASSTPKPQGRAVSSANPSPLPSQSSRIAETGQPLLKSHRSFASLRDVQESTSGDSKGFAKFLASKKADWRGDRKADERTITQTDVELGEGKEVFRNGGSSWKCFVLYSNGEGLGIVDDAVEIFTYDGVRLDMKATITLGHGLTACNAMYSTSFDHIGVITTDKAHVYKVAAASAGVDVKAVLEQSQAITSGASHIATDYFVISAAEGIKRVSLGQEPSDGEAILQRAETRHDIQHRMIPSSPGSVWTADKIGSVSRQSLIDVLGGVPPPTDGLSIDRLDSPVTSMKIVGRDKPYLVVGDEDGAVRIWEERSGILQGSWTMFADPVDDVALVDMPDTSALHGHLLCTSRDGTIGVISLQSMEHLYLIPASRAPLRRIFVGGKDILLAYANGKARVWNVETMEFRRSTGIDAADDMLQSGTWSEVMSTKSTSSGAGGLTPCFRQPGSGSDIGRVMSFDLATLFAELKSLPTPEALNVARGLLAVILTYGLDGDIDRVCVDKLGVPAPAQPVTIGETRDCGSVELVYSSRDSVWHVSPERTGHRQLLIVSLLRPFLEHEEYERYAAEAIAYYTASLPDDIVHANVDCFASFYLHASSEVQHAARMLFDSALERMSEEELQNLIDRHQAYLTSGKAGDGEAGHALLIIGGISLHKYQSVNPAALKTVSDNIIRILQNPSSPHLPLAIELCSRGFTIWQTYVDPMELLRRLFHLSTRKDSSSVSAHARLAVLHVASSNPALFMSTLSMDILDAQSAEGRTSIMKLCVYMARKKPEVLENGLPRIAEAVVKSLDPNIGKMRDDVWQAATVILNELVLAFSTIDFHSGTQKLAVGTHEGAVIMYELKTASRLYVLEPHRAPVSSVTFSPDGRRLLTVSLEEGAVTVWKVGSSLSGFFNVGGPPRQGALGGSGPFKRIDFARVEDAPLKSTSALSDVHVSWPGARQAKVEIGETAMSFET